MTKLEQKQALETILFVATRPLSPKQLAEMIGDCDSREVRDLVSELNTVYEKTGRIFRIDSAADGLQMHTLPEYKKWAQALETVKIIKLSPAVMETLAIVAYKQPLTRAAIEFIRGVDSSHTLRRLMQQKLVRIVGREMLPGRPGLYGTTKNFLEVFGLTKLKHLPALSELDMNKLPEESQLEFPLEPEDE
ncbi:MAG: SMC-Scp complex subunit ScpB [SAR324 cluster bacterium]|nr:SMC-Scp complex subunit ScpB [SAR324 cluster bacterium]MBL7036029.1 SMC-Scp complex subunit ScpB [SAR324 cluster bacterium]